MDCIKKFGVDYKRRCLPLEFITSLVASAVRTHKPLYAHKITEELLPQYEWLYNHSA